MLLELVGCEGVSLDRSESHPGLHLLQLPTVFLLNFLNMSAHLLLVGLVDSRHFMSMLSNHGLPMHLELFHPSLQLGYLLILLVVPSDQFQVILHFLHQLPFHIGHITLLPCQLLPQKVILCVKKLVIVSECG
jgi:hypothetical protein